MRLCVHDSGQVTLGMTSIKRIGGTGILPHPVILINVSSDLREPSEQRMPYRVE